MTGGSDERPSWPHDPDFNGPYAYCVLVIQSDGFRLGCRAPFVPLGEHGDLYRTLAEEQAALIEGQPRTMEDAFEIQRKRRKAR
jgi:hypothetical protein